MCICPEHLVHWYFYIHSFAVGEDGHLKLLRPQRINVAGEPGPEA